MPAAHPPGARRRPWTRRSDARPAELQAAALRLFARHGYGGATIDQIAREAGVTVGTVYRYYRDKDALRRSIAEWMEREPLLAIDWRPAASSPAGALRELFDTVWTASRRTPHPEMLRLVVAEDDPGAPLAGRYRDRVIAPVERAALAILGRTDHRTMADVRAALGSLLGASLLAGNPAAGDAVIPQIAPAEVTVAAVLRGMNLPPVDGPAAAVPGPPPTAPRPSPTHLGPDAW